MIAYIFDNIFFFALMLMVFFVALLVGQASIMAAATFLNRMRLARHQDNLDMQIILHSRHTIPITVIVAGDDHPNIANQLEITLASLGVQRFPEMETIVVLPTARLSLLGQKFLDQYQFKEITHFYCRVLETSPIHGIYRSQIISNLVLVSADQGASGIEHSDSLNIGLNLARYRYVTTVTPGIRLEEDALLHLISPALNDPAHVVGVRGPIGILADRPSDPQIFMTNPLWGQLPHRLWDLWQSLEQMRAMLVHQLAWDQGRPLAWSKPSAWLWRKDLLLRLGGFARGEADEMALRIHQHFSTEQKTPAEKYFFLTLPTMVGWKKPIAFPAELVQQTYQDFSRIRLVLWKYRHMLLRRRYGTFGTLFLPFTWLRCFVGPWVELAVFAFAPFAAIYGAIPWSAMGLLIVLLLGSHWMVNLLSLLFYQIRPLAKGSGNLTWKELGQLVFAIFFDPFLYQPLQLFGQLQRSPLR